MSEWYFILGITLIVFSANFYLRRVLHPRTNLIVAFLSFLGLMIAFISTLANHFSYTLLIVVCIYFLGTLLDLILKYKNLKANT